MTSKSSATECRVAFLRGINVGTAKRVAMADLRKVMEDLGFAEVATLLNSGNVVYTAPNDLAKNDAMLIENAVAKKLSVASRVTTLSARELAVMIRDNPL